MKEFKEDKLNELTIPCAKNVLNGLLYIPHSAKSLVLFVHGSGSSRLSSRNQFVAHKLNAAGHATLLFDLLTPEEDLIDNATREFRFDILLLANRLIEVTHWCTTILKNYHFNLGYFGASTGAGAALVAAAQLKHIKAVVSRGGRPDLAGTYLPLVHAPTLLIVGGDDDVVIELNQGAMQELTCTTKLEIIPGATHLFEEPGKLDIVADLAQKWFDNFLG